MGYFSQNYFDGQTFWEIVYDSQQIENVTFHDCSFRNCSFRETTFMACKFQSCVFKKCDLSLVKVDNSMFTNTLYEDSKVIGVNWVKASWGKTEIHQLLKSIDFIGCVLNYSTFMELNLEKMILSKCIVKEVDFSETNLKQAKCTFSDFSGSHFRHTNLSEADFTGATNYIIKPHLNTLKKTKFSLPEAMSLLFNLDIEIIDPTNSENS
jgi:fluoroquinolone resistance protein